MKRSERTSGHAKANADHERQGALLAEIINARGGEQMFSATEKAVARTCARLLSRDLDGRDAAILSDLMRLLPAERAEPPLDLSRLSDRQLDQLQRFIEIGSGQRPSPMQRARTQSARQHYGAALAKLVDSAERRGDKRLDADETNEARNLIAALLRPLVPIPTALWPIALPPPSPNAEPLPSASDAQLAWAMWCRCSARFISTSLRLCGSRCRIFTMTLAALVTGDSIIRTVFKMIPSEIIVSSESDDATRLRNDLVFAQKCAAIADCTFALGIIDADQRQSAHDLLADAIAKWRGRRNGHAA